MLREHYLITEALKMQYAAGDFMILGKHGLK